ncbi:MAG: PTS fructose IIA subunit family protein [Lysobacterales bacterium]
MSVGVLLMTHEGVGSSLMAAARRVMRVVPAKVGVFEVPWEVGDGEICTRTLRQELRDLDEGQGVLVLVDLYGATPFNLAAEHEPGRTLVRVAGLNLPMLLRVLNYPEKGLRELAEIARDGGRAGVVMDG